MDIKKELSMAVIELIREAPFYGHILVQMEKVILSPGETSIKTMGVGKKGASELLLKLFVCPEFIEQIYGDKDKRSAFQNLIELMKHEILHVIFGHLAFRLPDVTRRQVACDLSVNSYLDRNKLPKPPKSKVPQQQIGKEEPKAGVFPEDYGLEPKKGALWYYNALLKNDKFQQQCKNGSFGTEGMLSDAVGSHGLWEIAQEDPMLQEMMKDLVRKSHKICKEIKKYGDVPGELIEDLDDLTAHGKPVLPWQAFLRLFVASAAESALDYTMKRRSRRYGTRPGTRKLDLLELAIGIDTSGSISGDQLNLFFNEMYWIEKNGAGITVFECDTEIHREYPFREFDGKAEGRGGTELSPVLEEVSNRRFDGLIFFTDFYTPPIEKRYNLPILWILSECELTRDQYPYPWGQFIHIEDDMSVRVG